jgi:hypothetical protein
MGKKPAKTLAKNRDFGVFGQRNLLIVSGLWKMLPEWVFQ